MKRLALLLILAGCGTQPAASCPDDGTNLTYANFGQAFMSSYCVSCHGRTRVEHGVDLSTLARVKMWSAAVLHEAGTGTSMPPAGEPAPSTAERAKLAEWLACGGN